MALVHVCSLHQLQTVAQESSHEPQASSLYTPSCKPLHTKHEAFNYQASSLEHRASSLEHQASSLYTPSTKLLSFKHQALSTTSSPEASAFCREVLVPNEHVRAIVTVVCGATVAAQSYQSLRKSLICNDVPMECQHQLANPR